MHSNPPCMKFNIATNPHIILKITANRNNITPQMAFTYDNITNSRE